MTPDEFASLARRDFQLEYRVADPENGWNGQESDYAPWTITVVTYKDEKPLPEDEWLRYAEFDIESGLSHVATHLGLLPAEARGE